MVEPNEAVFAGDGLFHTWEDENGIENPLHEAEDGIDEAIVEAAAEQMENGVNEPMIDATNEEMENGVDQRLIDANNEEMVNYFDEPMIDSNDVGEVQCDANGDIDPLALKMERVDVFNVEDVTDEIGQMDQFHVVNVDDDVIMFYENEKAFIPKHDGLQIKQYDQFSGNLPFSIDVRTRMHMKSCCLIGLVVFIYHI